MNRFGSFFAVCGIQRRLKPKVINEKKTFLAMICARLFPCGSHSRAPFRSLPRLSLVTSGPSLFGYFLIERLPAAVILIHENFCNDLRKQVQLLATYRRRSAGFRIAIIDSPALLTQIGREKHLREEWKLSGHISAA